MLSSEMTTRWKKRRIGERALWDLIVNNDDVCFKHILPKLNQTDVKFLYEVNTETRALIKRSSREDDVEFEFRVAEMSSMSTLEFAWKNRSLWEEDLYYESDFCERVAKTNKLELLRWIREEKKCKWDYRTLCAAARQGNMEMVKYCVAKKCPMDAIVCAFAASGGRLETLKYLRQKVKAPWDCRTATWAAESGHLHVLEYLVERKCAFHEDACACAAGNGHLDCLKYLRETAKAPWDSLAVEDAHMRSKTECVRYLLDNECPLPEGWRYTKGVLHDEWSSSSSSSSSHS